MCVTARKLGESSNLICNITLFAILIYELFGPVITKQALIHSGDIQPMSEEVRNRRQIKLENAQGAPHTERFSIKDKNDEYNEKALNAFSYFAKTAMNDYTMEDIDPEQLINHYIRAEVVHTKVPSNKDPNKEVTFANLGDKSPADGFDTEPVARALTLGNGNNAAPKAAPKTQTASAPAKTGLDIDALLG